MIKYEFFNEDKRKMTSRMSQLTAAHEHRVLKAEIANLP